MERILIKDLESHLSKQVRVCGFIDRIRDLKQVQFVVLRDRTGVVQMTNEDVSPVFKEIAEVIATLTPESAVQVIGTIKQNPKVKLRGIELIPEKIIIESIAAQPLPIDEKTNPADRYDWRFLDLRQPKNELIFEVQTTVEQGMREYWLKNNFIELNSPKIMASPSESNADLFRVEYFERFAYLAQSPQFYKQMAMAAGFDRVFEIGPVFRAEKSHTIRHTTEITMVDMEMSWIESHEDIMAFEERWIEYILKLVKEKHGEQIKKLFNTEVVIPKLPFPRITMKEAQEILKKKGYTSEREGDFDPEGERKMGEYVQKEFGHEFVFVTEYPITVRPFYHMRKESDMSVTKSFDLLWKGTEITTGAQREHRLDILLKQVKEKGLKPEAMQFYLDFFKYGMPPHGGFGHGLARMIMMLLGTDNVREVTYLPRDPKRLQP